MKLSYWSEHRGLAGELLAKFAAAIMSVLGLMIKI